MSLESDIEAAINGTNASKEFAEAVLAEFKRLVIAGDHIVTGQLLNSGSIIPDIDDDGLEVYDLVFDHPAFLAIENGHRLRNGGYVKGLHLLRTAIRNVKERMGL